MKKLRIKQHTRTDFLTYLGVIILFVVMNVLKSNGTLSRSLTGQLVPICCYMSMAVSLNLTVGILGELSLGHAGFMSVGAFSGIVAAMSLQNAIPSTPLRLAIAMAVGAAAAALAGLVVGTPVLRLRGDYLAIVTLAFGEIIKELAPDCRKPKRVPSATWRTTAPGRSCWARTRWRSPPWASPSPLSPRTGWAWAWSPPWA